MKIYIASTLTNAPYIRKSIHPVLASHEITYDWTEHGGVWDPANPQRLRETAELEVHGVLKADLVLVLLPGGKGTHTELGLALAQRKRVWIYGQPDDFSSRHTCVFYHHPRIERRHAFAQTIPEDLFAEYAPHLASALAAL